jgi:hypothetical protein
MDFMLEHTDAIQQEVFWSTANLLNLTVDLIFFDTTNTYFEIDEPGPSELKAYGKSKHKRDDLPQVTILRLPVKASRFAAGCCRATSMTHNASIRSKKISTAGTWAVWCG